MGLFNYVDFGPDAVRAVHNGTADMRTVIGIMTSQTCGDACWHAKEEVCRCSCGGKNHGCLVNGGTKPERTSRIDGHVYRLKAIGLYSDIAKDAREINRLAGWRSVEKPHPVIQGNYISTFTPEDIEAARIAGTLQWSQYKYTWSTTDSGAPARLKSASPSQMKWQELSGWQEQRGIYLLWERMEKPEACKTLVVDKYTGQPLENQIPDSVVS